MSSVFQHTTNAFKWFYVAIFIPNNIMVLEMMIEHSEDFFTAKIRNVYSQNAVFLSAKTLK